MDSSVDAVIGLGVDIMVAELGGEGSSRRRRKFDVYGPTDVVARESEESLSGAALIVGT